MTARATGRRALFGGAAALLGVGLPVGAEAAPDADVAIMATCDEYIAAENEYRRLMDIEHDTAAGERYADAVLAAAMDAVVNLPPATTLAGLGAQARAVLAFYGPNLPHDRALAPTMWEVLHAVAGVPVSEAQS